MMKDLLMIIRHVGIKALEGVDFPQRATDGSAGFDLSAYEETYIYPHMTGHLNYVRTGLYIELPQHHVGMLVERSSLHKKGLTLANNIGVIDSDYRGEILIALHNRTEKEVRINKGQRIVQLIILGLPMINLIKIFDIDQTQRGAGGFGSTD